MPFGIEIFGRAFARRTQRGLYGGRQVLFGNKISEDGGNKSRRKWLPNVQQKKLWSDTLNRMLSLRVTTGALRNIDKAGGLDRYLYKIKGKVEDTQKAEQLRRQLELHTQRRLEAIRKAELERSSAKDVELEKPEPPRWQPSPKLMEGQML